MRGGSRCGRFVLIGVKSGIEFKEEFDGFIFIMKRHNKFKLSK